MKETIFADFHRLWPDRIVNMTNGVTPRRWLNQANPALVGADHGHIGKGWLKDLDQLRRLTPLAEDAAFRERFVRVKHDNKLRLADAIAPAAGDGKVDPDSLFDVQIKRIHEYKRQLLNLLHVITLYNRLRAGADATPRTVIFGGKAAPGYRMAKLIIRLINDVADVVNNDLAMRDRLKVVFIPNYDVSNAELIIPAADLSEQISTAGTEASGTGNMKLALERRADHRHAGRRQRRDPRGGGAENFFIFGLTADEVAALRATGYKPWQYYDANPELKQALDMIRDGYFCPRSATATSRCSTTSPTNGDHYLLLADYASYIACAGPGRCAVSRSGRLGAQGDPERGRHGQVLVRPHDRRIRQHDLECRGAASFVVACSLSRGRRAGCVASPGSPACGSPHFGAAPGRWRN
jgi:starch phosphorylase